MKIAYLILVHKNPPQILRLIDRLYRKQDFFVIHVDKKSKKEDYLYIHAGLKNRPNVLFTEKRYKTYTGHVSVVDSSMECMKLLSAQKIDYDYAIMMSGQHYPLVPSNEIDCFLTNHKGNLFMTFFPFPYQEWYLDRGGFDRYERWHFILGGKEIQFPNKHIDKCLGNKWKIKRSFPQGYRPYGGSHWFCIPKEAVDYLLNFSLENKNFVHFFKYVFMPEEIFFQTIFLNSPFKDKIICDNLLAQKWVPGNRHPEIFISKNIDELIRSGKLFARKFDTNVDAAILDAIDNHSYHDGSQENI